MTTTTGARSSELSDSAEVREPIAASLAMVKSRALLEQTLTELSKTIRHRLPAWPSVTASSLGAGIVAGSMAAETVLDSPFATAEYVVTMLVGALLILVGPLIVAVDQQSTRKHSADALDTLKELERQLAELEALRRGELR